MIQERDRLALASAGAGNGYRLMVDVMSEFGSRARVATWRLDIKRTGAAGTDREWTIADQERLSSVENIYRVALNAAQAVRGAQPQDRPPRTSTSRCRPGSVFVAELDGGVTGVVLLGRGARQLPSGAGDRTRPGQDLLPAATRSRRAFDAVFIRVNPADFDTLFAASALDDGAGGRARASSGRRTCSARSRRSRSSSISAI